MTDSTTTTVTAELLDVVAGSFVVSVGICVGVGLNDDTMVDFGTKSSLDNEEDGCSDPTTLSVLVGEVLEGRAEDSVVLGTFEGSVEDDTRGDSIVLECVVVT